MGKAKIKEGSIPAREDNTYSILKTINAFLDKVILPSANLIKEEKDFEIELARLSGRATLKEYEYNELNRQFDLAMKELDLMERRIQVEQLKEDDQDPDLLKQLAEIGRIKAETKKIYEDIELLKIKGQKEKIDKKVKKSHAKATIRGNDKSRGGFGDD